MQKIKQQHTIKHEATKFVISNNSIITLNAKAKRLRKPPLTYSDIKIIIKTYFEFIVIVMNDKYFNGIQVPGLGSFVISLKRMRQIFTRTDYSTIPDKQIVKISPNEKLIYEKSIGWRSEIIERDDLFTEDF